MSINGAATRPAIAAGTYAVDPFRTTVRFAVKELWGIVTVRGTFDVIDVDRTAFGVSRTVGFIARELAVTIEIVATTSI
ncbi:hypothetical protein ABZ807_24940 [Micromonospora sp. NPDC047548]|uniref:hypothetical protein n=1 Tax=Micromonospora sp. NPDC047548 TaxID=3155624 RepID=UPI0033D4DE2F